MPPLEKELIESIKNGNQKSFELVFKTYYSRLCNFAFSYTHQLETAEDLVKDSNEAATKPVAESPIEEQIPTKPHKAEAKVEIKEEPKELSEEELKEKRRQEIIQNMLAETKRREEEAGITVREMGETSGKTYSAVIIGEESSKNVKQWKKAEKQRKKKKK